MGRRKTSLDGRAWNDWWNDWYALMREDPSFEPDTLENGGRAPFCRFIGLDDDSSAEGLGAGIDQLVVYAKANPDKFLAFKTLIRLGLVPANGDD